MTASPLKSPAAIALAIAALAAVTLGGAWVFELGFGIKPCPLCLEQRYAYYVAIPLALLASILTGRDLRGLAIVAFIAIAMAFAANTGLGIYHAGVEWQWWPGPTDCAGSGVDLGSAGSLLQRLDSVKVVRCDEVQWRFLGLSLAGYNVLISAALALLAVFGIAKIRVR